jgi:hypothetical protein
MFAKSLALASLLISMVGSAPAVAQSRATGPPQADKVKAKITRVGTGKQARVEIKLKDNSKLKGYVGEIAQDHFTLIDPKQGTVTTITYDQVEKIKKTDQSWVTPLLLGAGTIGGVLILVVLSGRGG